MRDRWHEDDRLSALLDDELSEAESLVVTRHLAFCSRCMTELDSLRATRAALRGLPVAEPPEWALSRAAGRAGLPGPPRLIRARQLAVALTAIAAVTTLLLLAGGERTGDVSPPIDMFVSDHVTRAGAPVVTAVDLHR